MVEHDDAPILALLGLQQLLKRISALTDQPSADQPPLQDDDPCVLALLGAASVERKLQRWLDTTCGDEAPARAASQPVSGLFR